MAPDKIQAPPVHVIEEFESITGPACRHGFFTRQGGVSTDIYKTFNCGPGSSDNPEHVRQNLETVQSFFNADNLLTMHQTHSAVCEIITSKNDMLKRPQCDAVVTSLGGMALGVLTADCAPVLLHGVTKDSESVIGAAHAGWKGALGGVLQATLKAMKTLGAVDTTISAAVGPCIQQVSYEVDPEFQKKFENMNIPENLDSDKFFKAGGAGKLHFDPPAYVAYVLAIEKVQNVFLSPEDTYKNHNLFFSYRRSTHHGENDYGRQISLIMIN